jgi:hypothetical protein
MNSTRTSLVFAIVMMFVMTLAVGYKKVVVDHNRQTVNQPVVPIPTLPIQPEPPKPPEVTVNDAVALITAEKLREHVTYLASDQLEGRKSGERGCDAARDYLKKELESYGYSVMLDEFSLRGGAATSNVYAWMDGTTQPDQIVVVGAHYDHMGKTRSGICYGADDNASGTAGVLEIAKGLSKLKGKNKRTIVIQFYSGEEQGLLGSTHYCQQPKFPRAQPALNKHIFMENLDMIGYGKFTGMVADKPTPIDDKLTTLKSKYPFAGQILSYGTSGGASDHAPFAQRLVPAVFLHTGMHANYHKPSDTADKLNYEAMRGISQFGLELLWSVCQDGIQVMAVFDEKPLEFLDHGVAPFER